MEITEPEITLVLTMLALFRPRDKSTQKSAGDLLDKLYQHRLVNPLRDLEKERLDHLHHGRAGDALPPHTTGAI